MRVRTLRKHTNSFAPQPTKNPGRKYDVPDHLVSSLLGAGLVEVDSGEDETEEA